MYFASLKSQDRRIGGWNWPRITRIKQIFADFSNRYHAFSKKSVSIRRISVIRGELKRPPSTKWRETGDKFITGSSEAQKPRHGARFAR